MIVPTWPHGTAPIASGSRRSNSGRSSPSASGSSAVSARPSWPLAPTTTVRLGAIGTTSSSRGWAASAAEISACERGIGQAIAAVSSARLR